MTKLTSDEIDLRKKKIRNRYEVFIMTKGVSSPKRDINLKCVCTKQKSCKIREVKTDRTGKSNRHINYCIADFKPLAVIDRTTTQQINYQGYRRTLQHH